MTKKYVYIRIPVSPETYTEVRALADATSRTVPRYVRQVLLRFLECRGSYIEPSEFFWKPPVRRT